MCACALLPQDNIRLLNMQQCSDGIIQRKHVSAGSIGCIELHCIGLHCIALHCCL